MDWKLGYGAVGLIALLLSAGLIWYEVQNAPVEVSARISFHSAEPVINPYPELEGLKVRINSASVEELQQLPGIGATKAQAIYNYIKDYGKITMFSQLLEIEGIGEKTLNEIKPFLSLT
ncbi:helix-hairpin-helix domain-containing protein [Oscillospiraceae bacterium PP1C4]